VGKAQRAHAWARREDAPLPTLRAVLGQNRMTVPRAWSVLLLGAPLAFFAAFFVVPFGLVVLDSLRTADGHASLAHYAKALGDLYYWETLLLTFRLSAWVTLATFAVGYPLAYYIVRMVHSRTLRRLIYIVVITPLFTSNIVRAFGWIVLLGRRGLVNDTLVTLGLLDHPMPLLYGELSIVIGLTYIMVPFMVLTVAAVLQNVEPSLEDAARDLGAGAWSAFWRVTFPLSLPGVIAGSLIVFTLSVSAYVTPSILSGGKKTVMSMLIFQQYGSVLDFNFGAALAVILLVTTLILVGGYLVAVERGARMTSARPA
jgi:putative spermidine/putrescine transport system permease protein